LAIKNLNERKVFTLRLEDIWYQKMEHIAVTEHRTPTNIVELAVMRYVSAYEDNHGEIPVEEEQE